MRICSPECISVHLILTPWEAVYVHVELCNSVMKHPPVPELCTSIQSVLDSVLEPLKMCPDCHWHGNAECRSVLCWFMSPIFMETFFFYASLAHWGTWAVELGPEVDVMLICVLMSYSRGKESVFVMSGQEQLQDVHECKESSAVTL